MPAGGTLPDFLNAGRKHPDAAVLLPVLGGNGRWLAAQNPAGPTPPRNPKAGRVDETAAQRQQNGSPRLLRQLCHGKPALGRALVASTEIGSRAQSNFHSPAGD